MSLKLSCGVLAAMLAVALPVSAAPQGAVPASPPPATAKPQVLLGPAATVSTAALIGPEDCTDFDPSKVIAYGSAVRAGGKLLLNFGADVPSARHAVDVIHGYGFTQQCFVSRLPGAMMYWKVGGHIPSDPLPGEVCITVNPAGVYVFNSSGTWMVLSGTTPLARFGQDQAAAQRAVQLIKAYQFKRQCRIPGPNPVMTYWLL